MSKTPVGLRAISSLSHDPRNARTHSEAQIEQVAASIKEFGFVVPIAADASGIVRAGNARLEAVGLILARGETIRWPDGSGIDDGMIPTVDCSSWSDAQCRAYALADNRIALNAGWNQQILDEELAAISAMADEIDLRAVTGFDDDEFEAALRRIAGETEPDPMPSSAGSLAREFLIPPFSVLNAREGWWQDRKKAWLSLGIESEVGRGGNLIGRSLADRLSIIVPGHYSDAKAFIDKHRAEGMHDDDIEAMAIEKFGKPKFEAIPGGAGKNSVYRKGKIDGSNRLAVGQGGGLADKMAKGEEREAQNNPATAHKDNDKQRAFLRINAYMKKTGASREDASALAKSDPRKLLIAIGEPAMQSHIPAGMVYGEMQISDGAERTITGTSIFDPVLCEIAYRWFSPVGGRVLDPFAGGSVRGIVAAALGREYIGVDLRPEQTDANAAQWPKVQDALGALDAEPKQLPSPVWHAGDSGVVLPDLECVSDFIFSCPPYGDLEVYSDMEGDISGLDADAFDIAYSDIIGKACAKLADDRFACFVVGDYRDKSGAYRNFVSKTIAAFEAAGLKLYNEAILITATGSLAIRAAKQFRVTRKLGKTHQNILVFVKGDARKATAHCGPVDVESALAALDLDSEQSAVLASSELGDDEVKISAKMAMIPFTQCGPDCIKANGCKGNCCDSSQSATGCFVTVQDDEIERMTALGADIKDNLIIPPAGTKGCTFKKDGLCSLHESGQKPWGCIASPFTLNSKGTLIVRNRYRLLPCFKGDGPKMPAYQAFSSSLKLIFGDAEAERIATHLDNGGGDIIARIAPENKARLMANDAIRKATKEAGTLGGEV